MGVTEIMALLNNSQDAGSIALEICTHPTLNDAITDLVHGEGWANVNEDMFIIIRELWDIAYSYGFYDGNTEAEEDIV